MAKKRRYIKKRGGKSSLFINSLLHGYLLTATSPDCSGWQALTHLYQAKLIYGNLGLEVVLHHVFGIQEADGVLDKVVVDGAVLERNVPVLGAFAEPGGDQQRPACRS